MSDMKLNAKRILVPVNGDPATDQAFRWACHLARHSKAQLHAVHVIEVPLDLPLEEENPEAIAKSEEILGRIEAIAADEKCKDFQADSLRARHAGPAIALETEDRHMDAVIVGIPYRHRFGSCSLGSTATYIFNNATCQVILWRERAPNLVYA